MLRVGDSVRVVDGPFEDFVGTVASVKSQARKVTIVVNMFGRETAVQLDFGQLVTTLA